MNAESSDVLVIGGGVEGLAAATILARGGRRVRLLVGEEALGEFDAKREIHPGYFAPGLRPIRFPPGWAAEALELKKHGPAWRIAPADLELREIHSDTGPVLAYALAQIAERAPPEIADPGLADLWRLIRVAHGTRRRFGKLGFAQYLRMLPMSIEDWLADLDGPYIPEQDRARILETRASVGALALFGGWVGPLSPSSAFLWLLAIAGGRYEPVGGGPALIAALERGARAAGVEIELGAAAHGLVCEDGKIGAVQTDRGEWSAPTILSTAPPRTTLLDWIPARELDATLREDLAAVRHRGIVATLQVALAKPVEPRGHFYVGDTPLEWERAFDAVKHGTIAERPVFRFRMYTDDTTIAPEGGALLQLEIFGVPRIVDAAARATLRSELEQRVVARLESIAPGIGEAIVATELHTPADLEEEFGLPGGHLEHGELALDQIFSLRPCASLGHYRTPIEGLWIAGRGTHPGGPFPGSSGILAARAMLADAQKSRSRRGRSS